MLRGVSRARTSSLEAELSEPQPEEPLGSEPRLPLAAAAVRAATAYGTAGHGLGQGHAEKPEPSPAEVEPEPVEPEPEDEEHLGPCAACCCSGLMRCSAFRYEPSCDGRSASTRLVTCDRQQDASIY